MPTKRKVNAQEDAAAPGDVGVVVKLAGQAESIELQIEQAEANLASLRADLHDILHDKLPNAMSEANVKSFALNNGTQIDIKPIVKAYIPSASAISRAKDPDKRAGLIDQRKDGLKWLRRSADGRELIKQTITIQLGKGQNALARQFAKDAKAAGLIHTVDETVHQGSLSKFVKELLAAGKDVPFDTLNVFTGDIATIKRAKQED